MTANSVQVTKMSETFGRLRSRGDVSEARADAAAHHLVAEAFLLVRFQIERGSKPSARVRLKRSVEFVSRVRDRLFDRRALGRPVQGILVDQAMVGR